MSTGTQPDKEPLPPQIDPSDPNVTVQSLVYLAIRYLMLILGTFGVVEGVTSASTEYTVAGLVVGLASTVWRCGRKSRCKSTSMRLPWRMPGWRPDRNRCNRGLRVWRRGLHRWALVVAMIIGIAGEGNAQQSPPVSVGGVILGGVASIAVGTTSSNVALPNPPPATGAWPYPFVTLINDGTVELFYQPGATNAVVATAAKPGYVGMKHGIRRPRVNQRTMEWRVLSLAQIRSRFDHQRSMWKALAIR